MRLTGAALAMAVALSAFSSAPTQVYATAVSGQESSTVQETQEQGTAASVAAEESGARDAAAGSKAADTAGEGGTTGAASESSAANTASESNTANTAEGSGIGDSAAGSKASDTAGEGGTTGAASESSAANTASESNTANTAEGSGIGDSAAGSKASDTAGEGGTTGAASESSAANTASESNTANTAEGSGIGDAAAGSKASNTAGEGGTENSAAAGSSASRADGDSKTESTGTANTESGTAGKSGTEGTASVSSDWDSAVVLSSADEETALSTASVTEGSDSDETLKKLTETTESAGYKAAEKSGSNPLKLKKGQETVAVVQSELLLYQNLRHGGSDQNTAVVFDKYERGNEPVADTAYPGQFSFKNGVNHAGGRTLMHNFEDATNFNDGEKGHDSQNDTSKYSTVKAVACDPFGTGRDGCVAYVGLDCTGESHANVVTWLYDYKNGKSSKVISLGTLHWQGIDKDPTNAQMANYLAITAGNYDGTVNQAEGYGFGTDSVVIYVPSEGNGASASHGLVELQWQQDSQTHEITLKNKSEFSTGLLHDKYTYGERTISRNMYWSDKLACELATGDFDSDGIEDLAVLSYLGNTDNAGFKDATLFVPYLSVSMGSSDKNILENKTNGLYVEQAGGHSSAGYLWDTARSPGMSVGDANGDGTLEIAVAGIRGTQATVGDQPDSSIKFNRWEEPDKTKSNTVVAVYQVGSGNKLNTLSFNANVETNEWKRTGAYAGLKEDTILERSGVAFVALDGQYTQEQLFIDGSFYEFESGTAAINTKPVKTAKYFTEADKGAGSVTLTNTYIQSVAVGNFDHNYAGREQVMVVIGLKESKAHNDALALLAMGGIYQNDSTEGETVKTQKFEKHTGIYDNGYESRECYLNHCEGSNVCEHFSCCVVAVDVDDDGLKIKYSQINYLETDAEVQAVIQAAPEFGGLRQYELASATSYKITGSYTYETNSSHTGKLELGGIFGISADAQVVKWDIRIKLGYSQSWVRGTSESDTKTYTANFSATNQNLVVLRRNPFYRYTYELEDAEGQKSRVTYDVGQAPYYIQLSVEDYNSIVDSYNKALRERKSASKDENYSPLYLEKVEESYLEGNVGNPWKYQTALGGNNVRNDYYVSSNTISKGGSFSTSPSWIQLGYAAGSTEVSLTDATLNKNFNSYTSGITFSADTTFTFKAGPVAGGYVSAAGLDTTGSSETTGSGSGVSTRVGNIDKAAIIKAKAASESTIDEYSFQWCFAGGEIKIGHKEGSSGNEDTYVPLLHHVIKDLTAPLAPLTLKEMKLSESGSKKLLLTWTTPKDDGSGRKFYRADEMNYAIYQRNASEDDAWKPVVTDLVAADCNAVENEDGTYTLEYEISPDIDTTYGNIYQYAVRCSLLGKENTTESVNSNYKTLAFMITGTDTGTLSYLHIKYSDDGGKTFTANGGDDAGSWMGIYTDNKKDASANVSDYKWTQIKGDKGSRGEKGDKGDTGETGTQGEKGEKGDTGATGTQGEKGDKGDTGAAGAKGDKGDKGDTGAAGAKGDKGDKGDTGAAGAKGDKGDKGDAGADGRGIVKSQIDENGHLIITYSDGTSEDAGTVQGSTKGDTGAAGAQGEKGDAGAAGRGIKESQIDENGHLIIMYTDGTSEDAGVVLENVQGDTGATGAQGEKGDTGAAGRGIAAARIDENGHLIITYSDGTSEDAGELQVAAKRDPLVYVALAISILALLLCLYLLYSQRYSTKSMRRMWKKMAGLRDDDIGDDE